MIEFYIQNDKITKQNLRHIEGKCNDENLRRHEY